MMTKNPMQLKAFIKNKAAEKHISAQLVMQNYMLERLLEHMEQTGDSLRLPTTDLPAFVHAYRELAAKQGALV